MSRLMNVLSQLMLGGAQVANIMLPVLSERHKLYAAGALGTMQLVISALASAFNPDGTSAKVAYEPAKK